MDHCELDWRLSICFLCITIQIQKDMEKKHYYAPTSESIDIRMEGVLAASGEDIHGGEDD